jgi:diguanylate cyclase (GGDEF)-like protein
MQQIFTDNWAYMLFGIIFAITSAQLMVVYVLAESSKPPAGLGLFTVYFMASLLGWIALTLQQGTGVHLALDVPSVATIINSFILFMAMGQRAAIRRGRLLLGLVCLAACLCVFFLAPRQMFIVQAGSAALFFGATGLLAGWRAWQTRNIGDAIIAGAGAIVVTGMAAAILQLYGQPDFRTAQTLAFGVHSTAYSLVAIGFLASVLIEYQQHLSQLATEDPLTRLLNRRGLEEALQVTLAHASRQEHATSAIMVDIDHFKGVNDSFGQDTGDHVIRQVAEVLNRMSRASDVVARTGGEEFLLILPDTELNAARVLAERIREAIGARPLLVDSQRIPITVSLGVASKTGAVNLDELSVEADRAMYLAKHGGRNRVASVEHKPVHLTTASRKK